MSAERAQALHVLRVDHRVRDFEAWRRAFDGDPVGREAGGVRAYRITRAVDDPNHVFVELELESAAAADAFGNRLRALWAEAGPRLGLESPTARVLEVVEIHAPPDTAAWATPPRSARTSVGPD